MGVERWYRCLDCDKSSDAYRTMTDTMIAWLRATVKLSSSDWSGLTYTTRDEWDHAIDFIAQHEGHVIACVSDDGKDGQERISYIARAFVEDRGTVVSAVQKGLINEAEGRKMLGLNHVDFGRLLEGAILK